tara:strand:+ start:13840 stop:14196 length:357 start_codon:yes stop_codon:yes gene_type:complete
MIRLLPNTNSQTLSIIPREYTEASDLTLKIVEDGTKKTETLTSLTSVLNGNFLDIDCVFSILSDDSSYSIEVKQGSKLLYRDKIYCTSKTDTTISHTLNTSEYENYDAETQDQQYMII